MNRNKLLFIFFGWKTLQFCRLCLRIVWHIKSTQWQKKCKCANVETIEEIKELRIPSIVLSIKKNVLLWLAKQNPGAEYKFFFGRVSRGLFGCRIPKYLIVLIFSAKQLCQAYCSWRVPHCVTPSEYILQVNSKRTGKHKIPTKNRTWAAWFQLSPLFSSFPWSRRSCLLKTTFFLTHKQMCCCCLLLLILVIN